MLEPMLGLLEFLLELAVEVFGEQWIPPLCEWVSSLVKRI